MIKTDGIDHVVFFVKDYKKSRKFYEDVLGMTLAFEQPVGVFMNAGPGHLLALFQTQSFVATEYANYEAIREIAHSLGMIR